MNNNDKIISRYSGSASARAERLFASTGQRTSPYLASPSRENFNTWVVRERADGSTYRETTSVSRWNGMESSGDPVVKELTPPTVPTDWSGARCW